MFDWSKIAKPNFDDERRKKHGLKTGKQLFQESYQKLEKAEEAKARREAVEPLLKSQLIDHMVNRKPIQVLSPITNPTETINGLVDASEDEDDGFYAMNKSAATNANVSFVEVMETIPAGTQLIYKSWDKQLGQWIFKGSNGKEYAIYDQPLVMFQGSMIENPGFFGLLHQTNLKLLISKE